jgi:hypothetical protein
MLLGISTMDFRDCFVEQSCRCFLPRISGTVLWNKVAGVFCHEFQGLFYGTKLQVFFATNFRDCFMEQSCRCFLPRISGTVLWNKVAGGFCHELHEFSLMHYCFISGRA